MTWLPSDAQELVDYARAATEAPIVALASYDPEQDLATLEAIAGLGAEGVRKALGELPKAFRARLDRLSSRGSVNEAVSRCYLEAKPVAAPFATLAAGIMPAVAISMVERVTDLHHGLLIPLLVEGRVAGSLGFITRRELGGSVRRTCEAFARQAALTLEKARLLERLESHALELDESRRLMISAEERVRRDVAALLHGQVQTQLLVAWHRLGLADELMERDPLGARELVVQVRDQIDDIREHGIREASHRLHPGVLDVGLLPAVRSLAATFEDLFDVELTSGPELAAYDDPGDNRLSPDLRLAIYRVIEEALGNCAKHSRATQAWVRLDVVDSSLQVTIGDDGVGIDIKAIRGGLGLRSMSQHVGAMGGTVHIGNREGGGVEVLARFPLDAAPLRPRAASPGRPG